MRMPRALASAPLFSRFLDGTAPPHVDGKIPASPGPPLARRVLHATAGGRAVDRRHHLSLIEAAVEFSADAQGYRI